MRERPILFSAPMVRALLAGSKTQTRRVVKPQPPAGWNRNCWFSAPVWGWTADDEPTQTWHKVRCPYGQPGDRLWVREAWRTAKSLDKLSPSAIAARCIDAGYRTPWAPLQWEADGSLNTNWRGFEITGNAESGKLRPGIHMPRWASRITLEITGVRVERLQDISDEDARAEGAEPRQPATASGIYIPGQYRLGFRDLWDQINSPGSWDANPWVWVVEFRSQP